MLRRSTSLALLASVCFALLVFGAAVAISQTPADGAQPFEKRVEIGAATEILIRNSRGRVQVTTASAEDAESAVFISALPQAGASLAESELVTTRTGARLTIAVAESKAEEVTGGRMKRVDLAVKVPARARVRVEATEGAVDVVGDFRSIEARTTTGTIRADVPSTALRYDFEWTASRPRIYSLLDLAEAKEGRGGRFSISGRYPPKKKSKEAASVEANEEASEDEPVDADVDKRARDRKQKQLEREQQVELRLTTERGIVLIGADPATVPVDLRERTLTESARIFIRTGNEILIDRVRRLAPRLVDEYTGTLATRRSGVPTLNMLGTRPANGSAETTRLIATVTDRAGHPLTDLTKEDFAIAVDGIAQEVTQVTPAEAPFNLVLLLDVSGSVEERLDFIRRAALRFVQTASLQDRIAIITFRDDVTTVSDFTADRDELTRRINTIQAGGATAVYDALAYVLLETLRKIPETERERSAIVTLSDGDDNRSFLSFQNVLDLTREIGTPIYPLYVPSGLIPAPLSSSKLARSNSSASRNNSSPRDTPMDDPDPTRNRLLTLTTVAAQEGASLARETGGVFYPLARLEDLQRAYDDIVRQLRTSYTITYRPTQTATTRETNDPVADGIRIRIRRPNAVVARMGQPTLIK